MSHVHVLEFNRSVESDDPEVTSRVDQIVEKEFPIIKGWTRAITRGGILASGSVSYSRETADFSGTIVVFLNIHQTAESIFRLSYDVTACLAEKLTGDDRYYSFDGSFMNGLRTVQNARVALKRLADERRAMCRDFV